MNRLPKATLWLSVSALAFVANPVSAEENRPPKIKAAAIQVEMIQSDEIKLPAEFQILATAMNQTGDSLSKVVSVAAQTSEDVASSAHELASVSEQISLSAGQMATAMTEVSVGAEQQVRQLQSVDEALQAIHQAGYDSRRTPDGTKVRFRRLSTLPRQR